MPRPTPVPAVATRSERQSWLGALAFSPVAAAMSRVVLSAEWTSRTVSIDMPGHEPHLEWSLQIRVVPEIPARSVAWMRQPRGGVSWGGPLEREAHAVVELPITFVPDDWATSDAVEVRLGWEYTTLTDRALKEDPRSVVRVTVSSKARTGDVVSVAELPDHGFSFGLLVLVEADIQRTRGDPLRFMRIVAPEQVPPKSQHQRSA